MTLTGDIEAESAEQARQALLGRGLMPTEVTRRDGPLKSKRFQKFFQKPVTYKQIILFSKQFRTLFNAGVSIIKRRQRESRLLRQTSHGRSANRDADRHHPSPVNHHELMSKRGYTLRRQRVRPACLC